MRRKNPKSYIPSVTFSIEEEELENILEWNCEKFLGLKFLQRQINTPAGIIDVLAKGYSGLYYVIELKKGTLDAASYCQVHRYANYLNATKSKNGKRVFIPLLIGNNLSNEIHKCVRLFEKEYLDQNHYGRTFYTCYDMNPASGISFSYHNKMQKEYEEEHLDFGDISFVEDLYYKYDGASYQVHCMEVDLKNLLDFLPKETLEAYKIHIEEKKKGSFKPGLKIVNGGNNGQS